MARFVLLLGLLATACGAGPGAAGDVAEADVRLDAPPLQRDVAREATAARTFVAVDFNTGTSEDLADADPDDAYTPEMAGWSDQYYGDGLAWSGAINPVKAFFAEVDPDVVTFQEIFDTGDCPGIPAEAQAGFVCEGWVADGPSVARLVLGAGYQVVCNLGKPDKCAAVNRRFGTFRGCDADFCLDGFFGSTIDGCGKGARIGRGVIDLVGGGVLTLVNVHGSSGFGLEEQQCRVRQFEQIFVDVGDGAPAANGELNLIMGDLNTDPYRLTGDPSGRRLLDFVGDGHAFSFVTEAGPDATPTYAAFNIDHVISDLLTGECWHAGLDADHPTVLNASYFDHKPAACALQFPRP